MSVQLDFLNTLLVATAHGDRAAFAELYRLTSPRLFAATRRLLRNDADARDALQNAFIHIWQHADSFDPARGHALPWMSGVVRYASLDRLRACKRTVALEDYQSTVRIEEFEPGSNARLDITRCMSNLSATEQRIVLLAAQRGLSHSEISEAIGVPLGTVKSVVRRSMGKLRLCLEAATDHV